MSEVCLVIRRLGSDEEISRIALRRLDERYVEKIMRGLLHQMNTEEFYIDDSEVDRAREAESEKSV